MLDVESDSEMEPRELPARESFGAGGGKEREGVEEVRRSLVAKSDSADESSEKRDQTEHDTNLGAWGRPGEELERVA